MEHCVCRQLAGFGFRIERKPLYPVDLYSADQILLANALMGVVPVIRVDNTPVAEPTDLSHKLNEAIFGYPDIVNAL
jgi:para-aminobenzoate synthetase component 1